MLFKAGLRPDSECPRCSQSEAGILHMLWQCPRLSSFWVVVLNKVGLAYSCTVPRDPLVCVLGYVEEIITDKLYKMFIARLLFIARKLIAKFWIREEPPTRRDFMKQVDHIIALERSIYARRNKMDLFDRLWNPWLESMDSIATGSVPQDWRIANVVPIFKKGSKSELSGNYRPEKEAVFLVDERQVREIKLRSGNVKKSLLKKQGVVSVATSDNGAWLAALHLTGELSLWNKDSDCLQIVPANDVLSAEVVSAQGSSLKLHLYVSDDGSRVLLAAPTGSVYLWENTEGKSQLLSQKKRVLPSRWSGIERSERVAFPSVTDKEAAVTAIFIKSEGFYSGHKLLMTFPCGFSAPHWSSAQMETLAPLCSSRRRVLQNRSNVPSVIS
ncbi:unnamed protein product [Ranitomeya imitator]|uniref:Reverse transcriptase zinc-binding domain-containing protein n=1 Tax=Ranitomeya imitator TaxID=111125 RepID=A0ABN9LWS1_9NEOB|nr:unnamed protein product [Ranitomeya imitator]